MRLNLQSQSIRMPLQAQNSGPAAPRCQKALRSPRTYVTVISGLFIINALTGPAGGGLSGLPSDGVSASPSTHCPLSA